MPTATTPEPTPDPTAEPTDAPTPPDPAMLINEDTEEGAKSAALYFSRLLNYSMSARDMTVWEGKVVNGCEICVTTDRLVQQMITDGWIGKGGETVFKSIDQVSREGEFWLVFVSGLEKAYEVRDKSGAVVDQGPEAPAEFIFGVQFDSKWLLVDVG